MYGVLHTIQTGVQLGLYTTTPPKGHHTMATIRTSPQAQGVSLGDVRKQHPTLSNAAQVAVWKYGADVCAAVYATTDDGTLRGMQRDAARKAGMELKLYAPGNSPLVSSVSVMRKAVAKQTGSITDNERAALNAIIKSEYQDGGDPVGHNVWTEYCNPFKTKTTMSGVYASLVKKGLIVVGGSVDGMGTVHITQAGFDAVQGADDIIGDAPAKRAPLKMGGRLLPTDSKEVQRMDGGRTRSSAHTAKFTAKQLATMKEIAASARKHATK